MSSLKEVSPEIQRDPKTTPNRFKRKLLTSRVSRRYIMALFCCVLQFIQQWISVNGLLYTFTASSVLERDEDASENQLARSGNWTVHELESYLKGCMLTDITVQMPGALLIFVVSSHKFLLGSIILTSILHMLTPTAIRHHSASLVVILYLKNAISSPINIAVLSLWKDWAPSLERSRLIIFSFAGSFLVVMCSDYYIHFIAYNLSEEHFYYAGAFGLIWAVFWYTLASESPQSDPLISEQELLYLEGNIPSDIQQKIKIAEIPWKAILTSKQVIILSLIFVKTSFSMCIMIVSGDFLSISDFSGRKNIEMCFTFVFLVIIPCSAILADFLIRKFSGRTLLIRKCFLCGGFILQIVFTVGNFSTWHSHMTSTICYYIACIFFAASLPGFFTIPLDLSPRYVTVISGIIFTVFYLSEFAFHFILDFIIEVHGSIVFSWILLMDVVITAVCAVIFGVWGEVEEQLWSLTSSSRSRPEGYKSYPKPDDEDDVNLVAENI